MTLVDKAGAAVEWYVGRVPGWVVAATAAVVYAGGGLVLPLSLGWQTPYMVEANAFCTISAGVIIVAWMVGEIEAGHRRHLLEWTTSLRNLDATEFECVVGELFRREGWTVKETGRPDEADGNIDLQLTKGKERRLVQCKRWAAQPVGVDEIRRFAGTLLREGLSGQAGMFVTLSVFTTHAKGEAEQAGIEAIDGRHLLDRIEKVKRAEPCPLCSQPMTLDRSPRGWWFRCTTSGCKGKRDLGDAGRAAQYLVDADLGR